ncbi:MAG: arsenate reductase ArsC [Acidimicrobiales bacterium]
MDARPPEILFLCVHNAGRSQMAAAFARKFGGVHVVVNSAGSDPTSALNPAVVEAMREVGLDISNESPQRLTDQMGLDADVIVTMGCGDACPVYLGKRYEDWELEDPNGKDLETVRRIRDEIKDRVDALLEDLRKQSK